MIGKQELTQALALAGFRPDKYGHLTHLVRLTHHGVLREFPSVYRVRMTNLNCVVEIKGFRTPTNENPSRTSWTPVIDVPYDEVEILSSGKIKIGSHHF